MQRNKNLLAIALILLLGAACKPLANLDAEGTEEQGGKTIPNTPEDYLMAYYSFDDGTAKNTTSETNGGVMSGNPTLITDTPDGKGKALLLNGIKEQFVNIPYNLFKGLNKFSISLWVKDFNTGSVICGVSSEKSVYRNYPRVYFRADGKISFDTVGDWLDNAASFSYSYTSIQAEAWHQLVLTCNAGDLSLYIDGVLADKVASRWNDVNSGTSKVQIGGNADGAFPVFFSGKVDNVAVYQAVLSSTDIQALYQKKR